MEPQFSKSARKCCHTRLFPPDVLKCTTCNTTRATSGVSSKTTARYQALIPELQTIYAVLCLNKKVLGKSGRVCVSDVGI